MQTNNAFLPFKTLTNYPQLMFKVIGNLMYFCAIHIC